MEKTEHRMQLICDGVRGKGEILQTTLEEYKEVFVKARREFQTVIDVSFFSFFPVRPLTNPIFLISAWKTISMELEKPKKLSERQHGVVGADEELEEQEAQGVGEELEEEVEAVEQLLPEAADMMAMAMMTMTMMMTMIKIRREAVQEEEPGARRLREGRGLRPLEDEGQQLELGRLLVEGRDRQFSVSPLLLPIPKVH